jgi:hypothetical protein
MGSTARPGRGSPDDALVSASLPLGSRERESTARSLARWSAAIPAVLVPLVALLAFSVSLSGIAVYVVYFLVAVLGPGVLVARATLGRAPLLVADLALGGAVGLALQLGVWFVAVGAGLGAWMRVWPLLVYAVFALPALRRHWAPQRYEERMGPAVAWVLSLAVAVVTSWITRLFAWTQPVGGAHQWPFDLYWHLSLVELFARQVVPEDPQAAGHHLAYHWFADADMASASLMTGLDPATVLSRLWVVPLILITVGLLLAVLRELSPRAQPMAAVAAALLAARAGLNVVPWLHVPWDNTFAPFSPSQNYSYPFLLLTVLLVVRFLRGGRARLIAPLTALLILSPGVKATHLPILLSGLLLALGISAVFRAPVLRIGILAAVTAVSLLLGTLLIGAGGASGSGVQVLSTLRRNPVYYEFIGLTATQARLHVGLLPPGLALPGAQAVLALLLLATVVKYLWLIPGAAVLRVRRGTVDPVAWFLFGGGLGGWLLMLLIDQSGLSQVYFLSTGVILWFLLAGWGTVELWDRTCAERGRVATSRIVVFSAIAGVLLVWALHSLSRHRPGIPETRAALVAVLVPVVVVIAVICAVVLVLRPGSRGRTGIAMALGAALTAGSIVGMIAVTSAPATPRQPGPTAVTPAETRAARWLSDHAGPHDVVATNVHCLGPQAAACDGRGFWVSALTGRRTLLGGWAYLDETRALSVLNGRPDTDQRYYDQDLYRLNEALFRAPTRAVVSELRSRGVEWVFADTHRGQVSRKLADVAELVHHNSDVAVYRLDGTPPALSR